MTSLPTPSLPPVPLGDEQFLLRAFRSFAEAAGSLEHSYGLLSGEVTRLRQELEESNSGLAQSLEENRRMREHLDRILEGLPCGVLVVGEGKILRANPEARRLLGLEECRASGAPGDTKDSNSLRGWSSLAEDARALLELSRATRGEQEQKISSSPFSAGTTRWLAARHAAIPGNTSDASVFILRDVSERKRLEEAQERLQRERALAEMSAVLAHEIRNPLGSLELFAGLMAEAELSQECRHSLEHIQAGLRTLAATVNNVLHFHSLPEARCAPVDLGQLLHWAQEFFAPLTRRSRVVLSLQNRLHGVSAPADRHRLEQVLLNLVLNALRAMPGGGWIELAGHRAADGNEAVLRVTDTGPGIAPENLGEIFDPGFSTNNGGPGLGLAVCRKIVQQHGGSIAAEQRPGAGASFVVRLPLAPANIAAEPLAAEISGESSVVGEGGSANRASAEAVA
jgi:two-component system sensor histidine kinase FlrB